MIMISCIRPKIIVAKFDGLEYEGVHFKVEKINQMLVTCSHDTDDDNAKKLAKIILRNMPEIHGMITDVKIVDENGRLL